MLENDDYLSNIPESYELLSGNWVVGDNLWHVGFTRDSLSLSSFLSGLVEVREIVYNPVFDAVSFIVENKDNTGTLFHTGTLVGREISRYKLIPAGILLHPVRRDDGLVS